MGSVPLPTLTANTDPPPGHDRTVISCPSKSAVRRTTPRPMPSPLHTSSFCSRTSMKRRSAWNGWRRSWLAAARKCDLAVFARSASSLAVFKFSSAG